jgi:hypothetical protein
LKERIFDDYEVAAPPSRAIGSNDSQGSNAPLKVGIQVRSMSYVSSIDVAY